MLQGLSELEQAIAIGLCVGFFTGTVLTAIVALVVVRTKK